MTTTIIAVTLSLLFVVFVVVFINRVHRALLSTAEADDAAKRGTLVPANETPEEAQARRKALRAEVAKVLDSPLVQHATQVAESNEALKTGEVDTQLKREALSARIDELRKKGLEAIFLRDELEFAVLAYLGAETLDEDEKAFTSLFEVLNKLHAIRGEAHPRFPEFVAARERAGLK